jgi:hypothetical protein
MTNGPNGADVKIKIDMIIIIPASIDYAFKRYLDDPKGELFAIKGDNDKWGFVDQSCELVIPFKYDYATHIYDEGLALVVLNCKYGYINKTGREVISLKYDGALPFVGGIAAVCLKGKWGFIDPSGKEVIPFKYDDAQHNNLGYKECIVKSNNKWGAINRVGDVVIPFKYDAIFPNGNKDFYSIELNGKWSLFNIVAGEEVTSFKYDKVDFYEDGFARVRLNGKEGLMDKTGQEITPIKYDYIGIFKSGFAKARLNGEKIIIDKTGQEITATHDRISQQPTTTKQYQSTQQAKNNSGGCYIATACYGNYDCTQVLTFRNFRDESLSKTIAGRIFIGTYYTLSPPIALWLKNKHGLNTFIRKNLLDPIYDFLKKKY